MLNDAERRDGGLLGLLVGDALGVPYEFHAPADVPAPALVEFDPPPGYARAHRGVPPGTWSDDGAQALCLLASLLHCGEFDPEDFGARLTRWHDDGYMAVGGVVFDVGITTSAAVRALRSGTPAFQAGPARVSDNGNGSLMRALPLALWHTGTDAALVRDAEAQSGVTHGHRRARVCCALYCLWARRVLEVDANPWASAVASLRAIYAQDAQAAEELEQHVRPDDFSPGTGSGYVVDCLRSAHWAVKTAEGYEDAVRRAISLGNDTDTTACVAGGIAGLMCGADGIPERWRLQLRGQELLHSLRDALRAR